MMATGSSGTPFTDADEWLEGLPALIQAAMA